MRSLVFVILFMFSLTACSDKQTLPKGILEKEKMKSVLWDILQADAYTFSFIKKDSSKNLLEENARLQQQVFTIHKVTKEDFYTSFEYYKYRTDLMGPMLDSLIAQKGRDKRKKMRIKPLISP